MTKKPIIIAAVLISLLAVAGTVIALSKRHHANQPQSVTRTDQARQAPNEVYIQEYAFTPATVKVEKGTTVVWINKDTAAHTVEPDDTQQPGVFTASALLEKGQRHSITFNTTGTFDYFCGPHPYMKASVEVVES